MKNLLKNLLLLVAAVGAGFSARAVEPTMFVDSIELSVGDIADTKDALVLTNFPVRVVVSEESIPGFMLLRSGGVEGDGSEIRFSQNDGTKDVIIPHEMVEKTDTSFTFWVKVPEVTAGTKIKLHWGCESGLRPPVNRAKDVWSDYYGVWHHASLTDTTVKDASGNHLDAEKITGTDNTETSLTYLAVKGEKLPDFESDGEFTFTANYKAADDLAPVPAAEWTNAPILFGTWSSNRKNYLANHGLDTGWGGGWWNQNQIIFRGSSRDPKGDGDDWMGLSNGAKFNYKNRTFLAFTANSLKELHVYAATDNTALTECTHRNSQGWITPGEDKMLRLTRFGAYEMTEARLSKIPRAAAWLREEQASLLNENYVRVSGDHVIGEKANYWIEMPKVATSWSDPAVAAAKIEVGTPACGESTYTLTDATGSETYSDFNDIVARGGYGTYCAIFETQSENGHKRLVEKRYFAYIDTVKSSALSDNQVMIFNDADFGSENGHNVSGQGSAGANWVHPIIGEVEEAKHLDHVKGWKIRYGTIGSALPREDADKPLNPAKNYLPIGPEGTISYWSSNQLAANLSDSGAAILYNHNDATEPAAVYSPLYTSGVGEIYFDAVNIDYAYRNRLEIQYLCGEDATNTTGEWLDSTKVKKLTKLEVFTVREGVASKPAIRDYVPLMMSNSANTANTSSFYRVRAVFPAEDSDKPIRFRIARTDSNWGAGDDMTQGPGKILVDNILVCDPKMHIELKRIEKTWVDRYDNGKWLLGDRGTLTKPFPKAGEKDVKAKVAVSYTGFGSQESTRSGTVAALVFNYRNRYLNHNLGEEGAWKSIRMVPSDDNDEIFITESALELPQKPCDIEYYFDYATSPTRYNYFDYYGLNAVDFDVVESGSLGDDTDDSYRGNESNTPACGTDFFFRLREGSSDYERLEVVWKLDEGGEEIITPLHLIDDHVWTGALAVMNADKKLGFKIRGINRGNTGADNYWQFNFDTTKPSPYTDTAARLDDVRTDDETTIPDFKWIRKEVVSHTRQFILRFNDGLDENGGVMTLCRGDYQDFNHWTDVPAKQRDSELKDRFVALSGQRGDDGRDLGLSNSVEQKRYPENLDESALDSWKENFSTNVLWRETFSMNAYNTNVLSNVLRGTDDKGERTLNNGWIGKNFMYVDESLNHLYSTDYFSRALLLSGQGLGSLTCDERNEGGIFPDGLGEIKFDARLGQQHTYDRIATYIPSPVDNFRYMNYLVSARVAMSTNENTSADLGFDGQGTVSIFSYKSDLGAYEFRMKRISRDKLQVGLYRWDEEQNQMKVKEIYSDIRNANGVESDRSQYRTSGTVLCSANPNKAYVAFLNVESVLDEDDNVITNKIYAGFTCNNGNDNEGNRPSVATDVTGKNKTWHTISAVDSNKPLQGGTPGFLSTDCPASFMRPEIREPLGIEVNRNACAYYSTLALPAVLTETYWNNETKFAKRWSVGKSSARGKWTVVDSVTGDPIDYWGIVTPEITQELIVSLGVVGDNGGREWEALSTNVVNSFKTKSYTVPAYTTRPCHISLVTARNDEKPRYDIIMDNLELTQWHATTPDVSDDDNDKFVYTGGWITRNEKADRKRAELWPLRVAETGELQSIRSPYLKTGIGAISFSYDLNTLDPSAKVLIEVAENVTQSSMVPRLTSRTEGWRQVREYEYKDLVEKCGTVTEYLGLHNTPGLIRIRIPESVIHEAHDTPAPERTDDGQFGRIDITSIAVWDEPEIDENAWVAWNVRAANKDTAFPEYPAYDKLLLFDSWIEEGGRSGMSMELNNSVIPNDLVEPSAADIVRENAPYIQSPSIEKSENDENDVSIGEISFRVRKSGAEVGANAVMLVCAVDEDNKVDIENPIEEVVISDNEWTTKTVENKRSKVKAIRLVMKQSTSTEVYDRAVIDEVAVTERIVPSVIFSHVRPFRNLLDTFEEVYDIEEAEEQPLCDEQWGVQCELTLQQVEKVINTGSIRVFCDYYIEKYPKLSEKGKFFANWGYGNWKDKPAGDNRGTIELFPVETEEGRLVYRAKRDDDGVSGYVRATEVAGSVAQFHLYAKYTTTQDDEEHTNHLDPEKPSQWTKPSWYDPCDINAESGSFSSDGKKVYCAYTILDKVAPKRAWINEVELWDGSTSESRANSWIEVAIPSGVDMTGWHVDAVSWNNQSGKPDGIATYNIMTFGDSNNAAQKDASGDYAFYVAALKEAEIPNKVAPDAELKIPSPDYSEEIFSSSKFSTLTALALRLVRPSGVVDHEIVVSSKTKPNNATIEDVHRGLINSTVNTDHRIAVKALPDDYASSDPELVGKTSISMANVEKLADLAESTQWKNEWIYTPGEINAEQTIKTGYRIYPNNNTVVVDSSVATISFNPDISEIGLRQKMVSNEFTTQLERVSCVKHDSVTIYYELQPWYEFESIMINARGSKDKENILDKLVRDGANSSLYQLVLEDLTDSVEIVATVKTTTSLIDRLAEDYDNAENNPYAPAIIDWMRTEYPGVTEIGRIRRWSGATEDACEEDPLTITEMYWLGIPPDAPDTTVLRMYIADYGLDNLDSKVRIHLDLYNKSTNIATPIKKFASKVYGAYSDTWDSTSSATYGGWNENGPTLKVMMALNTTGLNGKWIGDEFYPIAYYNVNATSFGEDCERWVLIHDPLDENSISYKYHWYKYKDVANIRQSLLYTLSFNDKGDGNIVVKFPQQDDPSTTN